MTVSMTGPVISRLLAPVADTIVRELRAIRAINEVSPTGREAMIATVSPTIVTAAQSVGLTPRIFQVNVGAERPVTCLLFRWEAQATPEAVVVSAARLGPILNFTDLPTTDHPLLVSLHEAEGSKLGSRWLLRTEGVDFNPCDGFSASVLPPGFVPIERVVGRDREGRYRLDTTSEGIELVEEAIRRGVRYLPIDPSQEILWALDEAMGVTGRRLVSLGSMGLLDRSVEDLGLSVRSANCLDNANIHLVGQLVQKTEAWLMKMKWFGKKSLKDVKGCLAELGLALGMDVGFWRMPDSDHPRVIPPPVRYGGVVRDDQRRLLNDTVMEHLRDSDGGRTVKDHLVARALPHASIRYIGDLVQKKWCDLPTTTGFSFGPKSIQALTKLLARLGLTTDMDVGDWQRPAS